MSDGQTGDSTYVVLRHADGRDWVEVGTVAVPPRTKRRTILERAIGEEPFAGEYRVLDEESARGMVVSLEEQPPRLRIG